MTQSASDKDLENAIKNVNAKLSFYYHAGIFIVVNLILIAVNLIYSPHVLWFYWPLFGWGIGLASHGFHVFAVREGSSLRQRMIEKELSKK